MLSAQQLQAVLYAHGGEMSKKELATKLSCSSEELFSAIAALVHLLENTGLEVTQTPSTVSLRTARIHQEYVDATTAADTSRELGSAALEVLAIVLYKQHASRAEIDYMRGVNSSATLRQLISRGLIERTKGRGDAASWTYQATPETLAHVGVTTASELPEYEEIVTLLTPQNNA